MTTPSGLFPHLVRDGLCPAREVQEVRDAPDGGGLLRLASPLGGTTWVVTRHSDVRAVLGDPEAFSSAGVGPPFAPAPTADEEDSTRGFLLTNDPPEHTRLRRMLSGEFTVRRMRALEPRITDIVDECLDRMEAAGPPADLVAAFALPVPSLVICELLGVPYADRDHFQNKVLGVPGEHEVHHLASRAYMGTLIDRALADPGDNMIGMLIREHGADLSRTELINMADLILFAGHETTARALGVGTLLLLTHPEQRDRLVSDPDAVAPAIEELLRFTSVLQMTIPRVAAYDMTVCGQEIAKGDMVMVSLSMANRDPRLVEDGDVFDISRKPVSHAAFGFGVHHCLGAGLARAELAIALPALLRRFPSLAIDEPLQDIKYAAPGPFFGVDSLQVTWRE